MALSTSISIRDQATPDLQRMITALDQEKLKPEIGRAEVNLFKAHFYNLNSSRANKLGGKRTHFYSQAAKSTQYHVQSDGVRVSVNHVGIRQRLQGGIIKPQGGKKYLTIPAISETYGKRAREFSNLVAVFTGPGKGMLVEAAATKVSFGKKGAKAKGQVGGRVFYWLVKSVNQKPDPSVVPDRQAILQTAQEAVRKAYERSVRRGGPSA